MAAEVATTCTEDFSVLSSGFPNVLRGAYKYVLSADIGTREDSRKYPAFYFCSSQPLFVKMEDINRIRDVLEAHVESEKDWQVTSEFEGIADNACIEFCNTRGLVPELRKCLNEAEVIFSNMQTLAVEYDCFPADEYEEEGHLVIRVEVDSDQDTAFREYDLFVDWMLENIADDKLNFFVLTVNRIE